MTACHTDTRTLRRFGLWRVMTTPCLLTSQGPWAIAWAYVAPRQSVLISLYKKSPFLAKVFSVFPQAITGGC
jgi:hypothetical protein